MKTIIAFLTCLLSLSSFASGLDCSWREAETKMINTKDLLVLCPHTETFSITDTQNNSVQYYSNKEGFENRNIIFDQLGTGFISFNFEESFVTEVRWFDFKDRKFGLVLKLDKKLLLFSQSAKNHNNVHLFKNNGVAMTTLVGHPQKYSESSNEVIITTLNLITGDTVATKSASEGHYVNGSSCADVVSGSDVVEINGENYLIARNSDYYKRGCSAIDLDWDGSENNQFALINPIDLTVKKKISISDKILPRYEYGFKDIITMDGKNYLAMLRVGQGYQASLAVNLESEEVVTIPIQ